MKRGFSKEDILMEDEDILVVHKHPGIAVQSARFGQMDLEHELLNYLAASQGQRGRQMPYLAVIHRLRSAGRRNSGVWKKASGCQKTQ